MNTWIALFRGINVGGKQMLAMKDLREMLEQDGCTDVKTYIQSGNAVFRCPISDASRVAARLKAAVSKGRGFEPTVLILTLSQLEKALAANPFPAADKNPRSLHLFFLADRPKQPDTRAMDSIKSKTEAYVLEDQVFYLYAPAGFGISKLAQRTERLLGVAATARNWRTATAIHALAKSYG